MCILGDVFVYLFLEGKREYSLLLKANPRAVKLSSSFSISIVPLVAHLVHTPFSATSQRRNYFFLSISTSK